MITTTTEFEFGGAALMILYFLLFSLFRSIVPVPEARLGPLPISPSFSHALIIIFFCFCFWLVKRGRESGDQAQSLVASAKQKTVVLISSHGLGY